MSKSKRIRSRRKHNKEIERHLLRGDFEKAFKAISKDPEDSIHKHAVNLCKKISKRIQV